MQIAPACSQARLLAAAAACRRNCCCGVRATESFADHARRELLRCVHTAAPAAFLRYLEAIAMRASSGAARRAACCVHSCRWIRRCDGAGNCRIKRDRGYCRVRELFALPRLVFVWPYGACARSSCVDAATLLGGAYDVCAAAAGFADVVSMRRAESSTTEAIAACTSCLLCRGLLSCGPAVLVHDHDARCSGAARRAACCVHSCRWIRRCDGAGNCRIKRDRGYCRTVSPTESAGSTIA